MSYTIKRYKFKRYETEQKRREEETRIIDDKFIFDIKTSGIIPNYVLTNRVIPVLSIPLAYNPTRKLFEIPTGVLRDARLKAYYLSAEPSPLSVSDFDFIRMDEYRNLYVHLKARAPDTNAVVELQTESEDYKNLRVTLFMHNDIVRGGGNDVDNISVPYLSLASQVFLHGFDGQYWQRLRCDPSYKVLKIMPETLSNYVEASNIDSETEVLSVNVAKWKSKTFVMKNVGSNNIDIRVVALALDGGIEYELMSYTTLAPNETKALSVNDVWGRIKVYAKASTSGNPSNLRIDYRFYAC